MHIRTVWLSLMRINDFSGLARELGNQMRAVIKTMGKKPDDMNERGVRGASMADEKRFSAGAAGECF